MGNVTRFPTVMHNNETLGKSVFDQGYLLFICGTDPLTFHRFSPRHHVDTVFHRNYAPFCILERKHFIFLPFIIQKFQHKNNRFL